MQEVGNVGEALAEISALAWQYAPPVATAAKPVPVQPKSALTHTAAKTPAAKHSSTKSSAHPAAKKPAHKVPAAAQD
jgi:hypothetical protein